MLKVRSPPLVFEVASALQQKKSEVSQKLPKFDTENQDPLRHLIAESERAQVDRRKQRGGRIGKRSMRFFESFFSGAEEDRWSGRTEAELSSLRKQI
jgi:hypothetical protein